MARSAIFATIRVLCHSHRHSLSGSGTKTMPGSVMIVSQDFTLAGTVSATAAAAPTVNGSVIIGNGTSFGAGGYSHGFNGDF